MAIPKLKLADVVAEMRRLGVTSWANSPVGDIVLGPEPPVAHSTPVSQDDPYKEARAFYSQLLGRPVSDAEIKRLP